MKGIEVEENKSAAGEPIEAGYIKPMLAKEIKQPFNNDQWLFEQKLDGYRAIADLKDGTVQLYSRNSNPYNEDFPTIIKELKKIHLNIILDGEIVLMNEEGKPDFQKLQNYKNDNSPSVYYYIFDVIAVNGISTCKVPLLKRKELLAKLLKDGELVRINSYVLSKGIFYFEQVKKRNLEGMVAKKIDSLYLPGKRSSSWLKIKNHNSMDVIIAGFTKPTGTRKYFGSLVLASKKDNKLKYTGNVGTGFNESMLKELYSKLKTIINNVNPFHVKIPSKTEITWVKPLIRCEVIFSNLTENGIMRHPVFKELKY